MDHEELNEKIELLRAKNQTEACGDDFSCECGEAAGRPFGTFSMQLALTLICAILYFALSLFYKTPCADFLSEARDKAANDFSFKEQVYSAVNSVISKLNEIRPLSAPPSDDADIFGANAALNGSARDDTVLPDSGAPVSEPLPDAVISSVPTNGVSAAALEGTGGEFTPVSNRLPPENATFAPVVFTGWIAFPLDAPYRVTSGFGFREHPTTEADEFHSAADIAAEYRAPIHAPLGGVIAESEESGALGKHIIIDHGSDFYTIYGHCDELCAAVGVRVREGDVIARVGSSGDSTGNHLHFASKKDGLYFDPAYLFKDELGLKTDV